MTRALTYGLVLLAGLLAAGCVAPLPQASPGQTTRRLVAQRVSAVVVTRRTSIGDWRNGHFPKMYQHEDVDGGSAAPITADGYFLTADHVLERVQAGRHAFVIYHRDGTLLTAMARVVWRSASTDMALLHVPLKTPYFYEWTSPQRNLPAGTRVIHGGIATGLQPGSGKLATALAPEYRFTGARKFEIDIPLQPGDSGGPVVDAHGDLVGINSAVEFLVPMDTAFFVDSEGTRPNTRMIADLIKRDRARKSSANPPAE
ncbi:MAG: trypsin-like peptidase domain-containing protein [Verrucomicrobia bacterium]|nr:MAG: trypsin-like peptidase domain-containing protein [Verrucomicrobiota bacterium]